MDFEKLTNDVINETDVIIKSLVQDLLELNHQLIQLIIYIMMLKTIVMKFILMILKLVKVHF